MELDPAFFAVAIPAVLFAAISKGGFGGGAAFAGSTLLALYLPPAQAVGLMLPLLMMMDVTGLRRYWRRWAWPEARTLMAGAAPGILAGWLLFGWVSPELLRLLIGLIAIGFVAFQIARTRGWIPTPRTTPPIGTGYGWGAVAGFTSTLSHAGGPPAAMFLLGRRLDKTTYQATTVIVFWWVNLVKFPGYLALGMFTGASALANLLLAPVAVAGVLLGARLHHAVSDTIFFRITYALLLLTGGKLVWDALT